MLGQTYYCLTAPTRVLVIRCRRHLICGDLAEWLDAKDMSHVRGAPYYPHTKGKIERQNEEEHQALKNLIPANVYFGRGQKHQKTAP